MSAFLPFWGLHDARSHNKPQNRDPVLIPAGPRMETRFPGGSVSWFAIREGIEWGWVGPLGGDGIERVVGPPISSPLVPGQPWPGRPPPLL
ncbi:hypothetical protein E2320_009428 [Naja naja]|nr:hypothetical protein E2320_009428 [Naja naja]